MITSSSSEDFNMGCFKHAMQFHEKFDAGQAKLFNRQIKLTPSEPAVSAKGLKRKSDDAGPQSYKRPKYQQSTISSYIK